MNRDNKCPKGVSFHRLGVQCCREIAFILNRLYRDVSRYEHLIAILCDIVNYS